MKIINTDWSVGGFYEDKKKLIEEIGVIPFSQNSLKCDITRYDISDRRVWGTGIKANNHFELPKQYNEAIEYITGEKVVEDREIIGYKLVKPEYKKAVLDITNLPILDGEHRGYDIYADGIAVTPLKEAGVLDLWFELVYKEEEKPKYKINDWVIAVGNIPTYKEPAVGRIMKLNIGNSPNYAHLIDYVGRSEGIYSDIKRHATEDEILEAWSKKWMKENGCKIGDEVQFEGSASGRDEITEFKLAIRGGDTRFISTNNEVWFKDNPDENYQLCIKCGPFAFNPDQRIVKSKPIVIKGYEAEFIETDKPFYAIFNKVKFGCQEYDRNFVERVNDLIKDGILSSDYSDEIQRIVDHFNKV